MELIPDLGPPNYYNEAASFSTYKHMKPEFSRLGCTMERNGQIMLVKRSGRECYLIESETSFTSLLGFRLLKDKTLTNWVLQRHGVAVAEQHVFRRDESGLARTVVGQFGTAVMKPADGNKGKGVTVGVNVATFDTAWDTACAHTRSSVIVESHFTDAIEARYLVVDGRCVAVLQRVPPHVRGDGHTSVEGLVAGRNLLRKGNPNLSSKPIVIDDHRHYILSSQGLTLESVPDAGRVVLIDTKSGLSSGGDSFNITNIVHAGMKELVERVARVCPGLDVIGVDVLAKDHCQPPTHDSYIIVEVNTRPGLGGHIYPSYGESINVCRSIAEACSRKMASMAPNRIEKTLGTSTGERLKRLGRLSIREEDGLPALILPHRAASNVKFCTLLFGGDTSLGDSYLTSKWAETRNRLQNDPDSFMAGITSLTADRDFLITNFESVLERMPVDIFNGQKRYLGWDDPERTVGFLNRTGINAVSLANNHFMDFGEGPAMATIQALNQAGIVTFGAGSNARDAATPIAVELLETQVFVFSSFEYRRKYDLKYKFYAKPNRAGVNSFGEVIDCEMMETIRKYRTTYPTAFIIFTPHWGGAANYKWATSQMWDSAERVIDAGADLIIGHGAHALQEIKFCSGGSTVCSLGNFVYNSPGRYASGDTLPYSFLARLRVEGRSAQLRLYPFHCDNRKTNFSSKPATEKESERIFAVLRNKARSLESFDKTTVLGKDQYGFYLENICPLSPRFSLLA